MSGPLPILTIGQDCAGQTLYYGSPNRPGFFGLIRVGALGSGGVLGNLLTGLLGNNGLLGGVVGGSNGGLLGGVLGGSNGGLLGGVLGGSNGASSTSVTPVNCGCTRQYSCAYGNSGWFFSRSIVGNLLENVLNLVDNLLQEVLGVNPQLEVLVGDILSFNIVTTSNYPFNVWSSQTGQVYSGWSHSQGYVSGPLPILTIGQDCAGQTLYYGSPNQPGFFGLIRVGVLGSGGVLGNLLTGLLGNNGLLGGSNGLLGK